MTSDVGTLQPRTMPAEPGWLAELACCCPCRPRFRVQIPAPDRDQTSDLLLCGYHLQISLARLAALGAWLYDARNRRLNPADWV
jgi:hypothetical protein